MSGKTLMGHAPETHFTFQCACCGTCCKSDLEIFLNTLDVWNLRNALGETTDRLLGGLFLVERKPEYRNFPFCTLKMEKRGNCRFLSENLCSIHHARPAACRFFPVVQFYDVNLAVSFSLSPDIPDCRGRAGNKQYDIISWLIVNKYMFYEEIVEFIPLMALALREGASEEKMNEVIRIMYNFDTVEGFPYSGYCSQDDEIGAKVVSWAVSNVKKVLDIP